ncbi:hypothetical protein Vretimale_7796 [Volvox reticuliferus]|uniref:Uncharacterized protein n=1 Tax=Volvox reticuliferus TaxID=1737510 RepID=A0A8J4G9K9_9CHLO|nr:hypothetical protein Vretifemale_4962 [Volvox reticuliferus]GIM02986.1 hypothetical protein Vretimale_7796 [Volvox reticuliferus]
MSEKSAELLRWSENLSFKNRKIWKVRVEAAIMKAGSGVALEDPRDKANADKHNIAIGIIVEHLADSDLDLVSKHKDAKELLAELDKRYAGHSKILIPQLYAEMTSFKMRASESARDYIHRLTNVVEELKQCDEKVSDAYAITVA